MTARPRNCIMYVMKRKLMLTILIVFTAVLTSVGFCACNKDSEVTVTGIEISDYPKKYYAVNEEFSLDGGSIRLSYSDGGAKVISMSDAGVTYTCPGTNIGNKTNTAAIYYGGFKDTYRYHVSNSDKVVRAVEFEYGDTLPEYTYAKSSKRDNAPTDELNGLKIIIKYRNDANGDAIADRELNLGEVAYSSYGITVSGWDATDVGVKTMVYNYLADSFALEYEIVDDDWLESVEYRGTAVPYYLTGSAYDGGNAYFFLTYNSQKTEKINLTEDTVISGFDTSSAGLDKSYTAGVYIGGELVYSKEFTYSVFDGGNAELVDSVILKKAGASNLSVNDDMTYAQYLNATVLSLIMKNDGEVVNVTGDSEGVIISYSSDGGETYTVLSESLYNQLKTLGQSVKMKISYMSTTAENLSYVGDTYFLTIKKSWISTEITEWIEMYSVIKGASFDFGEAKIKRVYDDGTWDEYLVQDIYEMTVSERTALHFDINYTQTARDATAIDTTAKGTFNKKYNIPIGYTGGVTVNGETSDIQGYLYINYTVTEAA